MARRAKKNPDTKTMLLVGGAALVGLWLYGRHRTEAKRKELLASGAEQVGTIMGQPIYKMPGSASSSSTAQSLSPGLQAMRDAADAKKSLVKAQIQALWQRHADLVAKSGGSMPALNMDDLNISIIGATGQPANVTVTSRSGAPIIATTKDTIMSFKLTPEGRILDKTGKDITLV